MSSTIRLCLLATLAVLSQAPLLAQPLPVSAPVQLRVSSNGYRLGPGDKLAITVVDYPEYTGDRTVLPDGTINLPLLGPLPVAGLSVEETTDLITERLRRYLPQPAVSVNIASLRPVRVNVAGEVRRPGPVQLRNNPEPVGALPPQTPTLSVALTSAGGITQFADIRNVVLRRRSNDDSYAEKRLDLWQAITSSAGPEDIVLQDGDSLYIPKLSEGARLDRRLIARSAYAPATVKVRVYGEVKAPGELNIQPDASLVAAVAAAGGPTDKAALGSVWVARLSEDGRFERMTLDLNNLSDNQLVRDNDLVVVPKSTVSAGFDLLGALFSPLTGLGVLLNGLSR